MLLTFGFSFAMSVKHVSMSSERNSLGFLKAHPGLAMKIRKYTPPTTNSFGVAMFVIPLVLSGIFHVVLAFCNWTV